MTTPARLATSVAETRRLVEIPQRGERGEKGEPTQPVQLGGAGTVLVVGLLARVRADVRRGGERSVVITVRHQAQSDPGGRGSAVSHPADTVVVVAIVVTDVHLALTRPPLPPCNISLKEIKADIPVGPASPWWAAQ